MAANSVSFKTMGFMIFAINQMVRVTAPEPCSHAKENLRVCFR